jgi:hypothetical protein
MLKKIVRFFTPLNVIPVTIFALLLMAAMNIYVTKLDNDSLDNFRDRLDEQNKERSWDEISSLISLANVAVKQNSKFVASNLEASILRQYPNLDELKEEFERGKFGSDFHEVLKSNLDTNEDSQTLLNPPSYFTVVGLEDGVIAFFSSEYADIPSSSSIMSWNKFIQNKPNPELSKEAIKSVLSKDSGLIFWQNYNSPDGKLEKLDKMDLSTLKKAYELYGIEGLRYYSILSPSYITDSGDIFQTDDRTYLQKNKNYKLIILQSFNIAELLEKYDQTTIKSEKYKSENKVFIDEFIKNKMIKTVLWSFITFLLCILLVNIYNSERNKIENCSKKCDGAGEEKV